MSLCCVVRGIVSVRNDCVCFVLVFVRVELSVLLCVVVVLV